MARFQIKDMTCSHCVKTISEAITTIDAEAELDFDLMSHELTIDSQKLNDAAQKKTLEDAGFTPKLVG